ncbi:MAG: hypothetical protein MI741_06780 [Rhodospirillales bacterium]|nr:hypothetical protein [Rhodospirillales bacterium]
MTQVDKAIQSLVVASAELRYLALENPSCEVEYRAIAESLAVIAADIKASETEDTEGNRQKMAGAVIHLSHYKAG